MTENDLSKMQRDILALESRTWTQAGSKISEFRKLYPSVTEIGYYSALLVLLNTPAAYEYDGQRYAAMLRRLDEKHKEELRRRVGLRSVPAK